MTITLKVCDRTKNEMIEFFEDYKRDKTPQYAIFQADDGDTVVTLYESGKAVFQGKDADLSSQFWVERERHLNPLSKLEVTNSEDKKKEEKVTKDPKVYYSSSIGSDEVGTGDFFGPIVVCAAYVKKEDISSLEELGFKDSKKLTDEKILDIVPKIINKVDYECVILNNKEYNSKYSSGYNMNKLKAILHNKVLGILKSRISNYDYIVVDQFAEKYVYYNYLKESNNVVRDITFITKAEDKCIAVAVASCISRYIFLKEFGKMSKELGILIPKGANDKVDEVALKIAKEKGINYLENYVKANFKNYQKIKETI